MTGAARSLLAGDALVVHADEVAEPLVAPWIPLHAAPPRDAASPSAVIDVSAAAHDDDRSGAEGEPLLRVDAVRAFARGDEVVMRGVSRVWGRIALAERRAYIGVPADDDPRRGGDVYSMLTLASAFLIGRLGGALVHAGGVVDPEGRAWLLVGDTHAGKTTTCVSLIAAGWRYLADDQVVLRLAGEGEVEVEGWPRRAHLDEGWADRVVAGARGVVDLRGRWGDRWLARAPLGGVLLPSVRADEPTRASATSSAAAFAALVRQSPWLMADRATAPAVSALLQAVASRRALALSLGRDSYARGDVLAERLAALHGRHPERSA